MGNKDIIYKLNVGYALLHMHKCIRNKIHALKISIKEIRNAVAVKNEEKKSKLAGFFKLY